MAALQVAAGQPGGKATIAVLVRAIPQHLDLSAADLAQSQTRPNEAMWEQQVRNLVSHRETSGNVIAEGFATYDDGSITLSESGRLHLQHKGLL